MYFVECSVAFVFGSIYSIDLLNRNFFTVNDLVTMAVFTAGFSDVLKLQNVIAIIDCFFNRCTFDKVINDGLFDYGIIIIDIPSSFFGYAVIEITTYRIYCSIGFYKQQVIYVLDPNSIYLIRLKFKPCSFLPFATYSVNSR